MSLKLTDLRVAYPSSSILEVPSITLERTGLLAILGANGSGKTMLLKTLTGIMKPRAGELTVNEQPIEKLPFQQRPLWISTELDWDFQLTVSDILDLYELNCGAPGFNDLARLFQIDHKFEARLESLSSGEKRKVALFIAVTHPSPILILDEPTNFLEHRMRHELSHLLNQIAERKLVIFATHDIEWLAEFPRARCWVVDRKQSLKIMSTSMELVENTDLLPIFGGTFCVAGPSLSPQRKILYFQPDPQGTRNEP